MEEVKKHKLLTFASWQKSSKDASTASHLLWHPQSHPASAPHQESICKLNMMNLQKLKQHGDTVDSRKSLTDVMWYCA